MANHVDPPDNRTADSQLAGCLEIGREEAKDFRQVRRRPFAIHIGLGKADIAARHRTFDKIKVVHGYHRMRTRLTVLEQELPSIGQTELQGAVLCIEKGQAGNSEACRNIIQGPDRVG